MFLYATFHGTLRGVFWEKPLIVRSFPNERTSRQLVVAVSPQIAANYGRTLLKDTRNEKYRHATPVSGMTSIWGRIKSTPRVDQK